jgi:hypothetical protein
MLIETLKRTWKLLAVVVAVMAVVVARTGTGSGIAASVGIGAQAVGTKFQLNDGELAAYKSCRAELARFTLKAGGDMSYFCGCFAKEATEHLNDAHKALAVRYFGAVVRDRSAALYPQRYFPRESYSGHAGKADAVARSVARNGRDCAERANNVKAGTGRS